MTLCNHLWPLVLWHTCDHVWPCVTTCDYMSPLVTICVQLWPSMTSWDILWRILANTCEHLWQLNFHSFSAKINKPCKTISKETPFFYACRFGTLEVVQYFISNRDSLSIRTDRTNINGFSIYHRACMRESPEVLKYLLETLGKEGIKIDNVGWHPLHMACLYGSVKIVKFLTGNVQLF